MNRYALIIFSAFFLLAAFLPFQVSAASITETRAAIGEGCTASGDNSTAIGRDTTASGNHSTAMGLNTTASGQTSTAMGVNTIASGYGSVAMGYNTRAGGGQSFAGGCNMKLSSGSSRTFIWGDSDDDDEPLLYTTHRFLIFPIGTAGRVGIGTKGPRCLVDARDENTSFYTGHIGHLQLLIGNNAASTSGGKAAIGFAVSNAIDSSNIFGAMITHTPEDQYSNGGLEFWTKDTNTSTMTLTEKMRIDRNGNVGIGTTNPSKKLYVNGSAGGTQAWNASDQREKTDIKTIENALDNVSQLRGVAYKWKKGDVDESKGFDNKTHFGVIAQEVEKIYPELVDNPGDTEQRKHVEYNALVGILIEAVKELKVQNDDQRSKNEAQQAEIDELRSMIKELKS